MSWPDCGVGCQKALCFSGDSMSRVGETSSWSKGAQDHKNSIPESIVGRVFVPTAAPKVLTVGVQGSVAVVTVVVEQVRREDGETQLVLKKGGELFRHKAVVRMSAVIHSKAVAGEGAENGGKGDLDVIRSSRDSLLKQSCGGCVVEVLGEGAEVSSGDKVSGGGNLLEVVQGGIRGNDEVESGFVGVETWEIRGVP